jgi:sarcosine oxidase gamma subunit
MAIKFEYGGASFTADTPQEAAETLALLKRKQAEQRSERREALARSFMDRKISQSRAYVEHFQKELSAYDENKFRWSPDRFLALVERLGNAQKLALALLTTQRSVTDVELRNALQVPSNQALAGVLSGISKQALALFIPPRAIFDFENFRVGGKRRSDYLVMDEFRKIAAEMNWPPPTLLPSSPNL